MTLWRRELPPTAGLPLRGRDLLRPGGDDFATALAHWLAIPTPHLTCSGTAALVMALRALQAQAPQRTTLIVPAWTCPLVALAAFYCPPLTVKCCDLAPDSLELDLQALARLCDETTLAVVVTHMAGRVADVASASAIAGAVGAFVIEDAAQAMGARVADRSVGLEGDIGFFSLALGKGLTTAEGGVLFSRDAEIHRQLGQRCRQQLPFNPRLEAWRIAQLWGYAGLYHPRGLALAYGRPLRQALARGDEVAAVGDDFSVDDIPLHSLGRWRQRVAASALTRLPQWLHQGRLRARARAARLRALPGVQVMDDTGENDGVWPFLLVLMPTRAARDSALSRLWTAGLGVTRLFIHPLSGYPAVAALLADGGATPNADDIAARTLSITNSPWLDDAAFERIMTALQRAIALFAPRGVDPRQQP